MHCRQCGYALWNLPEPRCPECGLEFDVCTYRYQPGTVAFACPHCGHQHPGDGPNYQPVLATDNHCAGCGVVLDPHKLRVVPLADDAEAYSADVLPWEVRRELGRWKTWWETLRLTLAYPLEVGRRLTPASDWKHAYVFTAWVNFVAEAVFVIVVPSIWLNDIGLSHLSGLNLYIPVIFVVMAIAHVWVNPLLLVGFFALLAHGVLCLTGPVRGDRRLTFSALLYGQGPCVFIGVPICGWYMSVVFLIWAWFSALFILKEVQRISAWRAALALLPVPGMLVALFVLPLLIW